MLAEPCEELDHAVDPRFFELDYLIREMTPWKRAIIRKSLSPFVKDGWFINYTRKKGKVDGFLVLPPDTYKEASAHVLYDFGQPP